MSEEGDTIDVAVSQVRSARKTSSGPGTERVKRPPIVNTPPKRIDRYEILKGPIEWHVAADYAAQQNHQKFGSSLPSARERLMALGRSFSVDPPWDPTNLFISYQKALIGPLPSCVDFRAIEESIPLGNEPFLFGIGPSGENWTANDDKHDAVHQTNPPTAEASSTAVSQSTKERQHKTYTLSLEQWREAAVRGGVITSTGGLTKKYR